MWFFSGGLSLVLPRDGDDGGPRERENTMAFMIEFWILNGSNNLRVTPIEIQ